MVVLLKNIRLSCNYIKRARYTHLRYNRYYVIRLAKADSSRKELEVVVEI